MAARLGSGGSLAETIRAGTNRFDVVSTPPVEAAVAQHVPRGSMLSLTLYCSYAVSKRNGESQWRDEGSLPSCSINNDLLKGELHSNSARIWRRTARQSRRATLLHARWSRQSVRRKPTKSV